MPHAEYDQQDAQDEALIAGLLNDTNPTNNKLDFLNRDLVVGEKADDAVDFEDISDDDLAEDEDAIGGHKLDIDDDLFGELDAETAGNDGDFDDLFGDGLPSSPVEERHHQDLGVTDSGTSAATQLTSQATVPDSSAKIGTDDSPSQPTFRDVNYGESMDVDEEENEENEEFREQQRLFAQARERADRLQRGLGNLEDSLPAAPTSKEIFEQIWPRFEEDKPPRFFQLIPQKRAFYVAKTPLKPPKPIAPNKVNLDIAVDQERTFKLPSTIATTKASKQLEAEQKGVVYITDGAQGQDDQDEDMELDALDETDDHEKIGNVSWGDIQLACVGWDIPSPESASDDEEAITPPDVRVDNEDWMRTLLPTKKRKVGDPSNPRQFPIFDQSFGSWDDPEQATARQAKKIVLDMNDPYLLLDIQQPTNEPKKPRSTGLQFKRDVRGSLANPMFKRYNISNDEAYDALKENHQHKVRSTLGHMNVEHSLPATKLQYPFYQVALSDRELRSFHRPTFHCKPYERAFIEIPKYRKRKHVKNLKPPEAYLKAEDLSMGDNSDILLAEYSEEYPTTLSNFGMGNKIVNYYRRKDNEDNSRPKMDLGETAVLLPQDKSPFSVFGSVDPGETVPTLHNAMYRAPVFQHAPKSTDFLVCRSTTGIQGSKYYMRNIQNLIVVGQEFPSTEVPGTHARKVTEASKKRLKMLSFRLWRKNQQLNSRGPWVSNEMIKNHLPGTEIAQNRSRMREIMQYDKERLTWKPKDGEIVPDEATLRTWIKPEDICLIDSMHAGDRHLMDAGFNKNEINDDNDDDDGQKIELKLAPWHTTKNFLNACQGKAMLELHGDGDPTGRGEAFSFIKVSMKGGFKDIGESVGEKLDAKRSKELGGHSYNVARQQRQYEEAIKRIWTKQAESLQSTVEHSDPMVDADHVDSEQRRGRTPRSEIGTPAAFNRDDETTSQYSRMSAGGKGRVLRITRTVFDDDGHPSSVTETINDPKVIREYTRRQKEEKLRSMKLEELKPTGDAEQDARAQQLLAEELARLRRNQERREVREKAKAGASGSNPATPGGAAAGTGKAGGTIRKCANCGEVGHIKTNKKLCPLLNGQKKQSDTFKDASATSPATIAATPTATQMSNPFSASPQ